MPLRPPGAIGGQPFFDTCTTCGDCVAACPQRIIVRGSGNYPEIDFRRGECTFCDQCIDACDEGALQSRVAPYFDITLQVKDNCLAKRQVVCQTCGDACDAYAISFRPQIGRVAAPTIDEDMCSGCGACVSICTESAIKAIPDG